MQNTIITIDPEIQSGQAVFTGTRVPIKSFIDYITTGESIEAYLEDYPYVTRKQIQALMSLFYNLFQKTTDTILYENIDRREFAS